MSVNNPSHALSPSSQSSLHDLPARLGASSRPSDQFARGPDDHSTAEAQHAASPVASPTYDGAAGDPGHPSGELHDDGTEQRPFHRPFQPFFTLIEDAHTSDHHHPTVHYIFSDDDTDIVTEAAVRSLEAQQDASSGTKNEGRTARRRSDLAEHHGEEKPALLPPPIPGVRENYIVLDVEPVPATTEANTAADSSINKTGGAGASGTKSMSTSPAIPSALAAQQPSPGPSVPPTQFRVTSAKSFSPTWQVLSSEMVPAPTFEKHDASDAPGHGLMLKIHGTGGIPAETGKDKGERAALGLEDMMDQFARRMRELQMVIDTANVALNEDGEQDEEGKELLVEKTTTEDTPNEEVAAEEVRE
ncbi:uncharacterized protein N7482_001610 [Penicillium canariense]|uniref:Uncharacterized protein n=1 Tax=Penicillium canariense TaxID=189055 RepID=A0A9W9IDR2_9EURO|nr:uncharacterized protein N7482_001610 [Penicillium canariense]KAJ5175733.1 hypothetical protein N7482_001610 [Penicillium canariense]